MSIVPPSPKRRRVTTVARKTRTPSSKKYGNQSIGNSRQSFYFDPFPSQLRTKMRFVNSISLVLPSSPSNDYAQAYVSCNNVNEPQPALPSVPIPSNRHQPYGYDQVAALYQRFQVEKARIVLTPTITTANVLYGVCIAGEQLPTDFVAFPEQKRTNFGLLQGTEIKPLSKAVTWNHKTMFGGAEMSGTSVEYGIGAAPDVQPLFAIFAKSTVGAPSTVTFNISVEFDVMSYDMKALAQSAF